MALSLKQFYAAAATLGLLTLSVASRGDSQSAPAVRLVVVELFTSQGCSSCPPADALLGELAHEPNVLALAFHVDYWDSIGWRDRYAIATSVQRQNRYVESLGLSTAFTPQIVVNGRDSFLGSDKRSILAALAQGREVIPMTAEVAQGELLVRLPSWAGRINCDVSVVAFLPEATTAIGRGENSGRTLTEFNIVRQFRRLGSWQGESKVFRVALDSFPSDAARVAVLVQGNQQGPIVASIVASLRQR